MKTYTSHRRKIHCKGTGDKGQQSRCCPFCELKFWDRYHLQRHLTLHTCESTDAQSALRCVYL